MASLFYNRYIPPVVVDTDTLEESRPAKKRKKSKPKEKRSRHESPARLIDEEDRSVIQDHSSEPVTSENHHDVPMRDRHQAIFSKFEKVSNNSIISSKSHPVVEDQPLSGHDPETSVDTHGLEPLPQPAQATEPPKVSAFSALPQWLQNPILVSSTDTLPLKDLPINKKTVFSLQEKGYETAFAIQTSILPRCLPGPHRYPGDICISAATGSGKTLAYALPMMEALRGKPVTKLRGLIVVPTRELVNQVKDTLDLCNGANKLKIGIAVGSKSLKGEQALLIHKGQRYDPEGCKAELEREVDEDEQLMDWDLEKRFGLQDDFQLYYNYVVEYTSKVDILICTPGRLVEHIESTTGFTLHHVQWLVVDEADRLLDENFQQWTDVVIPELEYLPSLNKLEERIYTNTFHLLRVREIRKIILSATMTRDVSKLTALKLKRPRLVVLEGQQTRDAANTKSTELDLESGERVELPSNLTEVGLKVLEINDKPLYLIRVIDQELSAAPDLTSKKGKRLLKTSDTENSANSDETSSSESESDSPPQDHHSAIETNKPSLIPLPTSHGTLVFTNTNEHATRLARLLSLTRPSWSTKISTLTKSSASSTSRKTLTSFQSGKTSILIASDRASRGLDIPNLAHVINYDMPSSLTSYIHRVGRTARAGKVGKATTLIADNEARWFWNEVARSERVGRGKRVGRDNGRYVFSGEERGAYEKALEKVGKEARG